MRVLHVINSLELAGAEVLLADLVPRLQRSGIRTSIALLNRTDTRLDRSLREIPGCEIFGTRRNVRSPLQVAWLAKLFGRFDVVHSHLFPSQFWVAAAAKIGRTRAKLVTTEHGHSNNRRGKRLWYGPDVWMYTRYDRIVCNSQATAEALHQWVPSTTSRTIVIPNGIDLDRFDRDRPSRDPGAQLTAIFVARLNPEKDHLTLLRAMKTVPDLRLKLVGDGSLRSELEATVAEFGLNNRVEFLGWRDNVSELLSCADIYVHSTHFEGFAIAVAEAMAAGLPTVASNVPGLSWVAGDAALLCKPGDSDDMASQLRRLVGNKELRKELGQRGRLRARQFSIDATVSAHIHLYESLVGPSQTAGAPTSPES